MSSLRRWYIGNALRCKLSGARGRVRGNKRGLWLGVTAEYTVTRDQT